MNNDPNQPVPQQPIAYDSEGRPLYAHPQTPQVVYMARPLEPVKPHLSPEIKARSEESRRLYPELNMSEGEFVISAVRRHVIGILSIWLATAAGIAVVFGLLFSLMSQSPLTADLTSSFSEQAVIGFKLLLLAMGVLLFVGGVLATIVYQGNRFFLTNESVIQFIRNGIFSRKVQTISLINIEDASYSQDGIIQHLLGYGSLRLSTEGDETTYRFSYVANPHEQINLLNNAIESFKNGRPILND